MKKLVVALLLAAMTMTAVTGCGNGGAGASNNASEPAATAPADTSSGTEAAPADTAASGETQDITLKVWCPQNQVDTGIMEKQQTAFAAEHPEWNITWKTEIVGEDKCQDSLLKDVGAAADVFMFASD